MGANEEGKVPKFVAHKSGFTPDDMTEKFKKAGLVDISAKVAFGFNFVVNDNKWTEVIIVKALSPLHPQYTKNTLGDDGGHLKFNNDHFNKTAQDYNLIPQAYELTERASKIVVEEFTTSTSEEDLKNARVLELDEAL
ncbi:hypothetical protein BGZ98_005804, partial [Dissophora globulifera]